MEYGKCFSSSKDLIYIFEFLLLIESDMKNSEIGNIGFSYEYKNEYGIVNK